jgi:hypothetical protein
VAGLLASPVIWSCGALSLSAEPGPQVPGPDCHYEDARHPADQRVGEPMLEPGTFKIHSPGGHDPPDFVAGYRVPAAATWPITLASETLHEG